MSQMNVSECIFNSTKRSDGNVKRDFFTISTNQAS